MATPRDFRRATAMEPAPSPELARRVPAEQAQELGGYRGPDEEGGPLVFLRGPGRRVEGREVERQEPDDQPVVRGAGLLAAPLFALVRVERREMRRSPGGRDLDRSLFPVHPRGRLPGVLFGLSQPEPHVQSRFGRELVLEPDVGVPVKVQEACLRSSRHEEEVLLSAPNERAETLLPDGELSEIGSERAFPFGGAGRGKEGPSVERAAPGGRLGAADPLAPRELRRLRLEGVEAGEEPRLGPACPGLARQDEERRRDEPRHEEEREDADEKVGDEESAADSPEEAAQEMAEGADGEDGGREDDRENPDELHEIGESGFAAQIREEDAGEEREARDLERPGDGQRKLPRPRAARFEIRRDYLVPPPPWSQPKISGNAVA
ncbi:MAG: hypothetical protein IPN83_11535 [Holophagales bacterium]|nr:hypothetical protein [Holophagales bacterium]